MWGAEAPNLPGSGVLVYQNFVITFPVTFFYILMFGASVLSEKVQCSIYTLNNSQSWLIILCKQLKRREHDTNTIYMHRIGILVAYKLFVNHFLMKIVQQCKVKG